MERSGAPGHDMAGEFPDSDEDYGVPVPTMRGSATAADIDGAALEAGSVVIDKSLSRLFVAAYLLTGSAEHAEVAVSESIQQLDTNETQAGSLSWKAVDAAIMRGDRELDTADETPAALPIELLRVLRLSPLLRRCFVLRVLMAMPRHYCAGLLRIDAEQVDANSCLAAQELARVMARETTN